MGSLVNHMWGSFFASKWNMLFTIVIVLCFRSLKRYLTHLLHTAAFAMLIVFILSILNHFRYYMLSYIQFCHPILSSKLHILDRKSDAWRGLLFNIKRSMNIVRMTWICGMKYYFIGDWCILFLCSISFLSVWFASVPVTGNKFTQVSSHLVRRRFPFS